MNRIICSEAIHVGRLAMRFSWRRLGQERGGWCLCTQAACSACTPRRRSSSRCSLRSKRAGSFDAACGFSCICVGASLACAHTTAAVYDNYILPRYSIFIIYLLYIYIAARAGTHLTEILFVISISPCDAYCAGFECRIVIHHVSPRTGPAATCHEPRASGTPLEGAAHGPAHLRRRQPRRARI